MSKVHYVKSVQKLPVSLDEAWNFFSNPENLLAITPPFLNLRVTNKAVRPTAYAGQIITYTVKPLLGIPLAWLTEITHVVPRELFVDEQRKGPYKLWHHQHHFREIEGGVEMMDLVHYRLPMGFLGEIANAMTVRNKLKEIFAYRFEQVNQRFGAWPGQGMELIIQ
jgi:ligand-binding SRPBCC domain-containing protein